VQEVFCEALARVDRIGPNRRLVFVITQPDRDGGREQVAVLKIALSAEVEFQAAQAILNDGGQPLASVGDFGDHLGQLRPRSGQPAGSRRRVFL
jgi:hypothetical protein